MATRAPGPDVDLARTLIDAAESVAVLTGAGISTDSGIPDFRGPQGLRPEGKGSTRPRLRQPSGVDTESGQNPTPVSLRNGAASPRAAVGGDSSPEE